MRASISAVGRMPMKFQRKIQRTLVPNWLAMIGDAVVDAVDERGNGDDGGHADDDAENGEAGAQLVGAQRVQRHADGFAGVAEWP